MLKTIGIIGYGWVGRACHYAFQHNSEFVVIDPKMEGHTIENLNNAQTSLTFVAVNAPTLADNTVDASVIYDIFQQLSDIDYRGLVVLKSTLTPDIVHDLYVKFPELRYIYSPEFMREAHWQEDTLYPSLMVMAGDFDDCNELADYYTNNSHIKNLKLYQCGYKEAALIKYAINSFLATKVTFMNQMFDLFSDLEESVDTEGWRRFSAVLSADPRIGASHLGVPGPDGEFGYGGSCFPKDIRALIGYDKNERLSLLREVEITNSKIRLAGDSKYLYNKL